MASADEGAIRICFRQWQKGTQMVVIVMIAAVGENTPRHQHHSLRPQRKPWRSLQLGFHNKKGTLMVMIVMIAAVSENTPGHQYLSLRSLRNS